MQIRLFPNPGWRKNASLGPEKTWTHMMSGKEEAHRTDLLFSSLCAHMQKKFEAVEIDLLIYLFVK